MHSHSPTLDPAAVAATAARLDGFAATLSPRQQAALSALLARAAGAPAPPTPLEELAGLEPAAVLDEHELALFERLEAEPAPARAGPRARLTMIMKATRLCNFRCTYCHSWKSGPNQVMTFPVLARAIRDCLRDPGVRMVEFVWHGGEVTLLPVAFYRKALWLLERFRRPGQRIDNVVQTNGTHLTDAWLDFLKRYDVSVSVSLDGPPEVHDRRRVDVGGRGTSARVRDGLRRMAEAGIRVTGVLVVVDDAICDVGADRLLHYLLEIGVTGVGLLNVVPENTPAVGGQRGDYLLMPRFLEFLRDLFRLWYPAYVERIFIRELSDLAGALAGSERRTCILAGNCHGGFLTIETNGDVSACDKYDFDPAYRFGNLLHQNVAELQFSESLAAVKAVNAAALRRQSDCPWFTVCRGACPHDRYMAELRVPGFDARCCGFAPLLEEMATAFHAHGAEVFDPRRAVAALGE